MYKFIRAKSFIGKNATETPLSLNDINEQNGFECMETTYVVKKTEDSFIDFVIFYYKGMQLMCTIPIKSTPSFKGLKIARLIDQLTSELLELPPPENEQDEENLRMLKTCIHEMVVRLQSTIQKKINEIETYTVH